MLRREGFVQETLLQIRAFLDGNDDALAGVNRSDVRKRLDGIIESMSQQAVAQVAGLRESAGETARQLALREWMRRTYMAPIATIATGPLRAKPELSMLRLPRQKCRRADFITAARDMADAAEQYTDLFVREGLDPDFAIQLRGGVNSFEQSIAAWGHWRAQSAGATKALEVSTRQGRDVIKLLDALVSPRLKTNAAVLAEWKRAKRIRRS